MGYGVTILLFAWYQRAVEFLEAHLLTCPSKTYLHIICPGCGLQRSFVALLRGNVRESFILHPATIPVIILFIVLLFHLKYKYRKGALWLRGIYLFCATVMVVQY